MPFATEIRPVPGGLADSAADVVAVPVRSGDDGPVAVTAGTGHSPEEFDARLPAPLADLIAHYELTGKPGETASLAADLGGGLVRLALLGVGASSPDDLRTAGAALARLAKGRERAAVAAPSLVQEGRSGADDASGRAAALSAFTEGALLASYTFTMKSADKGPRPVGAIDLVADDGAAAEPVRRGTALARATALARDLINMPSLEKDPEWLAGRAEEIGAEAGLDVEVWDEERLEREGFGAIVAVGQGSARPPRLVRLDYRPENPTSHVVLVGKGITFDTGGLQIKPTDNMVLMKTDMSGSAIVLGVLSALGDLGARVRVTGLIPLAENSVSGSAQRPGDVITTYDGRTVEVLNTDAEGRLVMADAMAYAVAGLAPDTIVDVATLTGAAKVALGTQTGALFSSDDALAEALEAAGRTSGNRCGGCRWWRSTATRSTRPWRTWPTSARARTTATPVPRRRRCSCGSSPAACRGRTSTSPGRAVPPETTVPSPRAAPASPRGCCCTG